MLMPATTDLQLHLRDLVAVDSHEHLLKESMWIEIGPRDVMSALFGNYVQGDFWSAGMSKEMCAKALDENNPDLDARWELLQPFWDRVQFTGYGEACSNIARLCFGMEEITPDAMRAAQPKLDALRRPGERLRLLRDV